MDFNEWMQIGLTNGWCGPAVCYSHDGLPTTLAEDEDENMDSCIHIIRLYEDASVKAEVESNHSPSAWRATNSGFEL